MSSVIEGGPAEKAGIKPGQVIVAVNGIPVEHPDALGYRLTTVGIGHVAKVTVSENGKTHDIELALAGSAGNIATRRAADRGTQSLLGCRSRQSVASAGR
ncbi:PDZ domain-containing protein [Rhizobium sp. RCAM05350]|nr:PDZ domain-containing protein [Rhizobium sp. RCAM05350]